MPTTCPSITTAVDHELGACFVIDPGQNGGTITAISGFITRTPGNTNNFSFTEMDGEQVTAGAMAPTMTDTSASSVQLMTVAFKP